MDEGASLMPAAAAEEAIHGLLFDVAMNTPCGAQFVGVVGEAPTDRAVEGFRRR